MRVDIAVVGAGIAGCFVAWELSRRGAEVVMVDAAHPGAASPVAAGLYNPLRFRDLSPVDYAEPLVALMQRRLDEIEQLAGRQLYWRRGIARLFGDASARELWRELSSESNVIGRTIEANELPSGIKAPFGAGHTEYSGYVEADRLQGTIRSYFTERGALLESALKPAGVQTANGGVTVESASGPVQANAVVLCQGAQAAFEPLYPGPRIDTLRGETLRLSIEGVSIDRPLHRSVYVVPRSDGTVVVGSTYERENRELEPTEEARTNLLASLSKITPARANVVEQRVGLRPVTEDGLPVAGLLAPGIAIANGLGPKGVLFAPAAAAVVAKALDGDHRLPAGRANGLERADEQSIVTTIEALHERWRPDRSSLSTV